MLSGGWVGGGCNTPNEMMKSHYFRLSVVKVPILLMKGSYFSDALLGALLQ